VPTGDSAPAYGAAGRACIIPSVRLVTYVPAGIPGERVEQMIGAVVPAHHWEHPVVEVDRVSLWMPTLGGR
jgi:hypothetical protein